MKMLVAIVQDEDAGNLVSAMMEKGMRITKLATTGGFLRAGNSTIISGVEEEQVEEALDVIRSVCKSREELMPSVPPMSDGAAVIAPYPVRVMVGGATVFVLDVEQFVKI